MTALIACPTCGSSEIEAEDYGTFDEEYAAQEITCSDCDHKWIEVYRHEGQHDE
jgi:DNA-directed RNA polymerase subunit RPC12/RpoP